jgi:creatinine amidohydrolase
MLERLTWTEACERFQSTTVALIPVGSTEQHGPHLPLGTDFLTAQALARAAAEETGAVCTPVIPVGVSSHHRQFWGTLTVSPDAFRAYMRDLALSVASHGAKRLVFANGHGGNSAPLLEVCRDLRAERIFAALWNWWLDPEIQGLFQSLFRSRGTHAGAGETSMIWVIDESLVQKEKLEEAAAGASETFGVVKYGAQLPFDTVDFSKSGATLDPREASREAGEQIFSAARGRLVELIRWLQGAPDEELVQKAHAP